MLECFVITHSKSVGASHPALFLKRFRQKSWGKQQHAACGPDSLPTCTQRLVEVEDNRSTYWLEVGEWGLALSAVHHGDGAKHLRVGRKRRMHLLYLAPHLPFVHCLHSTSTPHWNRRRTTATATATTATNPSGCLRKSKRMPVRRHTQSVWLQPFAQHSVGSGATPATTCSVTTDRGSRGPGG